MKKYTVFFANGSTFIGDVPSDKTIYEVLKKFEDFTNTKFTEIKFIFDFDAQSLVQWNYFSKTWILNSYDLYKQNLHK